MRMNDIEYEFTQDVIEKKITARSARSTRTHNGKRGAVKFPSDYKTKKEIKAMSGAVITYPSLKKPMSWEAFKNLPDDLKKEYITFIREEFGAPDKYIAEMFGISGKTLTLFLIDLKLNKGRGSAGRAKWKTAEFDAWRNGEEYLEEIPVEEPQPIVNTPEEVECKVENASDEKNATRCDSTMELAVPATGMLTFDTNVGQALRTIGLLLGNKRAKLTITWEIANETNADS